MSKEAKMCPVFSIAEKRVASCKQEACAIWDDYGKACGFSYLADLTYLDRVVPALDGVGAGIGDKLSEIVVELQSKH